MKHVVAAFVCLSIVSATLAAEDRSALLREIDQVVEATMERDHIPGTSIAVARGDELIVAKGYGWADVENRVPATEHTVYRIGSVTKQFTAAALLKLQQDGKLRLDQGLDEYLPDYPLSGFKVTLEQLLNHTCGIKGYTEMPTFWEKGRTDLTHEQMIELFSSVPFEFEPGDRFQYSNSGYYLAGVVIEKVAGVSYAEYLQREFFAPLGMLETHYLYNRPIVPGRAEGYDFQDGELLNDDLLSMHLPYAAGSLGSSVLDLVRWQRSLLDFEVLNESSHREMTTRGSLTDGSAIGYGLGVFVSELEGRPKIEHGGGINGFRTQLSYYPEQDLTVAVVSNLGGASPDVLETRIARLVMGLDQPRYEPVTLTDADLETYAGVFDMGRGPLGVQIREGALWVFGQRLLALGEHRFVSATDVDRFIDFEVEDGKAVKVRMVRQGQVQAGTRSE